MNIFVLENRMEKQIFNDKNIEKLPKTTRSKDNLRAVFDYIEQYPIIDIKRTAKELDISYNTVATAVKNIQKRYASYRNHQKLIFWRIAYRI